MHNDVNLILIIWYLLKFRVDHYNTMMQANVKELKLFGHLRQ